MRFRLPIAEQPLCRLMFSSQYLFFELRLSVAAAIETPAGAVSRYARCQRAPCAVFQRMLRLPSARAVLRIIDAA